MCYRLLPEELGAQVQTRATRKTSCARTAQSKTHHMHRVQNITARVTVAWSAACIAAPPPVGVLRVWGEGSTLGAGGGWPTSRSLLEV